MSDHGIATGAALELHLAEDRFVRCSAVRMKVDEPWSPSMTSRTERFDKTFGATTSTISLPQSGVGALRRDDGALRLPVTLRFDQSLDLRSSPKIWQPESGSQQRKR